MFLPSVGCQDAFGEGWDGVGVGGYGGGGQLVSLLAFIYNILAEHLLRFISHLAGGTDRATGTPTNRSRCTELH